MDNFPYRTLYTLAREIQQHQPDIDRILELVLQRAGEIASAQQGVLMTFQDGMTLGNSYVYQMPDSITNVWKTLLMRGLVGYVYYDSRVVVIHNIATDPRWPDLPDDLPQTGSAIGLPVWQGNSAIGVLLLWHPAVAYFDGAHVNLLVEITDLLGDALTTNLLHPKSHHSDQDYHTIFDNSVVPIIMTDLTGQIIDLNQQASSLLACDPKALTNTPITALHAIDLDTVIDGVGLAQLGEAQEHRFQTVICAEGGEEIPVMVRLRHLVVNDRHVIEWIEQDIRAQMELEQLRRDLSAMVYHDLRGPLQTMSTSIQKLSQVLANYDEPAVLALLQVGIRSARQLRRMVDSLLDVQRLEEGNAILDIKSVDLHKLLVEAVDLVQPLAVEAGQRLKFALQDDLPVIAVDNDMILRVVINLMENAIKYTPTGGSITLIAYQDNDHAVIRVRDSGPGIPQEMTESIFDKFNRVSYKKAPKGLGLGLAFCRLAVTAHDGRIWVESELGHGSDFIFTLPLGIDSTSDSNSAIGQLATTA